MFRQACLGLLLLLASSAWSQINTDGTDATNPDEDSPMLTPPPVSGVAYSTAFASETQSNYLRAGVTFSTAYSTNVGGGETLKPIGDVSYSIWPTVAFYATTTRSHLELTCSPGFTIYQRVSALDQSDQNLNLIFQYRLTPHVTASLSDSFLKTSNPFNQTNPLAATPVSGSAPVPSVAVIVPVADQILNGANVQVTYQFGADEMIGLSGIFSNLSYRNPEEAAGLFNSSSTGESVFYSHRILQKHYVGVSYLHLDVQAYQAGASDSPLVPTPTGTQTHIQTIFLFGTVYLKPTLSLSLSAGPQRYDSTQSPLPSLQSWSPMAMASVGWQGQRTSLAASYSRSVTAGGGLVGAYHSNIAAVSGAWQLGRTWSAGLAAAYSRYTTLPIFLSAASSGGSTVSGTATVQHSLGEHMTIQTGYTWLQQRYGEIAAISAIPDTNRAFVSLSYQFERPLKR